MEFGPEFVTLFDRVQIRYYGIIIVAAMLVAATVAARLARRDGRDPDHIWGGLTWAIIPAIIMARLWFILFPPQQLIDQGIDTLWFFQNFFDLQNGAIAIWSGGLSIFGAFLGGFLGAYIYIRRNKLPIWPWLDIAGVAIPLGQAIGRWANFVNQELYGIPTTLPWGLTIAADKRVAPYTSTVDFPVDGAEATLFHPLFLYESLWSLLAFIVLMSLFVRARDRLRPGDIFLLYVMQYSVIRFLLEFLRIEVAIVAGVNISQVVTAAAFVIALIVFILRRRQPNEQPETSTATSS
ncbi:MAG: prolipoprotein diacylglyceryl transferase [Chloroflexi bacterium]|nr:prolipoprotein diacylglyceryl transferase [Chloroflexota bacterium]